MSEPRGYTAWLLYHDVDFYWDHHDPRPYIIVYVHYDTLSSYNR